MVPCSYTILNKYVYFASITHFMQQNDTTLMLLLHPLQLQQMSFATPYLTLSIWSVPEELYKYEYQ